MGKGKLNKNVLGDFLESECERQLYLNLGKKRNKWGLEEYSITELERPRMGNYIAQIGKEYEQKVYRRLKQSNPPCLIINPRTAKERSSPQLTKNFLLKISKRIRKNPDISECCLLEYDFPTPKVFILDLFQMNEGTVNFEDQEPPTAYSHALRPDILLIGNKKGHKRNDIGDILNEKNPILMMNTEGKIEEVPEHIRRTKIGINIIDIKATRKEKIGKRHFFEIIFYWKALVAYLEKLGLDHQFYVRVDNNGILPGYNDVSTLEVPVLRDHIVELPFADSLVLYDHISETLTSLFHVLPRNIEDIPIRLQPICARCDYLEDCKKQLKYGEKYPREEWDLCLLPYMSQNISEELKDLENPGFDTIEDVARHISEYSSESVPTPLYAEKPFLKYRALSLLENEMKTPEAGEISSIAIPRRSPISLVMDFETDPLHEIVSATSFNLNIFLARWNSRYTKFGQWWTVWTKYLEGNLPYQGVLNNLDEILDSINFSNTKIQKQVSKFRNSLKYLIKHRENKRYPWLILEKRFKSGESSYHKLNLRFALINENFTRKSENQFAKRLITLLHAIIIFIQTLEFFLSTEEDFLNSAVYYWSWIQMDHLQEFLERNLDYINDDPALREKMLYIIRWFNPSESSVEHPYHHKKIYDLRAFAENTLSVPLIINYTWHGVAHYLSTRPRFEKYFGGREQTFYHVFWNKHFNYIDFQQWYKYISHKKKNEAREANNQKNDLIKQMIIKVRTIDKLREIFQNLGKRFIAGYNKPKPIEDFFDFDLREGTHQIAKMWHLFEQYTAARDKLDKDRLRSLFPEFGIGRLESAKTEKLTMIPTTSGRYNNFYYEFQLRGVSSNVKIGEGSWVTLIPELIRHQPRFKLYQWRVVIERMEWRDDHWQVRTRPWSNNILEYYLDDLKSSIDFVGPDLQQLYREQLILLEQKELESDGYSQPVTIKDTFHIYPRASNPWKKKLKNLFKNYNFGKSWLGKALAYRWKISNRKDFSYPKEFPYESWLPDVYMYAPYLLPEYKEHSAPLWTSISPTPDPSQQESILESLNHPIYGIQGPPGTGKSQTIAALIDEFILRNSTEGNLKILVTTFSYAALRVVLRNIVNSKNLDGGPTTAARSTCAFMRSNNRERPSVDETYWDITFSSGNKSLTAERSPSSVDPDQSTIQEEISEETSEQLADILCKDKNNLILFGNAHKLVQLHENTYGDFKFIDQDNFQFDLIIVDEASQLPVNYFLASLQYVKKHKMQILSRHPNAKSGNEITSLDELEELYMEKVPDKGGKESTIQLNDLTNVVIVGDQKQLPPVQPVKPPKKLEPILDNLFGYYCDYHDVANKQLEFNYRSNQKIVDFTNFLNIYENEIIPKTNSDAEIRGDLANIKAWNKTHSLQIVDWIQEALDPSIIMGAFVHGKKYETAVSELEAEIVTLFIMGYYLMIMPDFEITPEKLENAELDFWKEKIGVVAPHNAQGRLIIKKVYDYFVRYQLNFLPERKLMNILKTTVVSVEKFQGSARDVIIASIGISAKDQLMAETEFIYDLNRFNVLTSRARKKFILICSENFLKYIPDDRALMENAAKIRRFALDFCSEERNITLVKENGKEKIQFRYHN
ncbi:MAG: AAA domain-containing protein [Promethearchaeia archaeon]